MSDTPERENSFNFAEDLPKLKPDSAPKPAIDPKVVAQIAKDRGYDRSLKKPEPQPLGEMLGEPMSATDVRTVGDDTQHVPEPAEEGERVAAPPKKLGNKPEQTKLSGFNLPLSFRELLKDVADGLGANMTEVLIEAARPQLEAWSAHLKKRKKR
jgi:hypothetical protein